MALPNTDKLTSQLAMMPDPALKRMAMMHKQDPYVLPLIIAEDSRRKQMRAAGQAAQYAPQPKVVDQEVAQLGVLPEQQGIGTLPAQNIAQMADGGIAGYADGGPPIGYNPATGPAGRLAYDNEPVLRMADGGIVALAGGGTGTYSYRPYESAKLFPETTGYENMSFGDMVSDIGSKISGFFGSEEETLAKRRREAIARENARREAENAGMRKIYETTTRAPYGGREPPPPMPGDKETADTGRGAPAPGALRQNLGALAAGAGPLSVDDTAAQLELQTMKDERQREGERAMAEFENMMQMRRDNPAFAKLEAALDKEEAASAGEKDKAAGLALLMAGLGIAGGSSRYGIQNLKEALPAVKEYQSAMNDLKKLERERMKMRGEIEQFRRAEERDDEKTMMALRNRMEDRKDKIDERGAELTSKVLGLKTQQSTEVWKTLTEQQGANYRTQAQLSQEPAELRTLKALQRDPKLMEAYTRMQQTRGSGLMGLLGKYADPAELEILRTTNPALYAQVLSQMQAALGGGFTSLPQGATVLPPKK